MKTKTEKKEKSKTRKVVDGIIVGFFSAILLLVLGFNIANRVSKDKMVFGTQCPVVLTDSMEPDYKVGSVLVVKKVDPATLKVGDDVSFYWDITGSGQEYSVTHRIIEITVDVDKEVGEGRFTIVTHGINKHSNQSIADQTWQHQTFTEEKLIGKVTKVSWFLTGFYKVSNSIWGLLIFILLPCLYLVVTSVIDIVHTLNNPEEVEEVANPATPVDTNDPLAGLSEDEKEKLKKQMLDEILGGKKK